MNTKQESAFTIPILTYHSIDNSGSVISTSPEKFKDQVRHLSKSSFNVVTLREIITCIIEKQPFPSRSVAITFDDGFKNVYDVAYPILKEFDFRATIFLVTGYCGRNNRWNGQPEEIPTMDLLDWDEIIEMAENGIEFGAHTVNHPNLAELAPEQSNDEIVYSKSMIQKKLGKDVQFFAYPYGGQTGDINGIIKKEFIGACSTDLGFVTLSSELHSLPRIDMYYFSQNNLFPWLGTSLFYSYVKYRNILRSFKRLTS